MRILLITTLLLISFFSSSAQTRKKKNTTRPNTTALSAQEAKAHALFEEMLSSTQELFIVDSIVVETSDLLREIPLSPTQGRYLSYSELFGDTATDAHVFVNGFGNKCYYATNDSTGQSHFFTRVKLGGQWAQPKEITSLGEGLSYIDYPFMSADGTKLFFSAKSEDGLGEHDIYVTTYNAEDDSFLQADNLGLPFNSTADDLIYVEDDTEGFGWFASTRRQTNDKICIYTFVPAEVRQNYDISTYGTAKVKNLAQIMRIRDTWSTPELRDEALVRLKAYKNRQASTTVENQAIRFVVDNSHVYTNMDDFLSPADRQLFLNLQSKRQRLNESTTQLEQLRQKYHAANKSKQRSMRQNLLNAEHDVESLQEEVRTMEKQLRNNEILLRNK